VGAGGILKMANTLHIILDKNRHSIQHPQRNASAQWRRLREIDKILQTEAQRHALRKLYADTVCSVLGVIVGFERDLAVSNVTLAGEFDAAFRYVNSDAFRERDEVTAYSLEFCCGESHTCIILGLLTTSQRRWKPSEKKMQECRHQELPCVRCQCP
jgi:hypothetical protein